MTNISSPLRAYLHDNDPGLAARAENFWQYATPILDRQSRPGSNENGFAHVEQVERNIWRFIDGANKVADFNPFEWFILSCAALSHDFDKGVFKKLPEGMEHGKGSADFLLKNYKNLQGNFPEMVAIGKIIALHALPPDEFRQGLSTLDRQFALSTGPVDLQKLAVILKTADILHTDNSRIAPIGIDTSAMDEFDLKKHQAREAISGWIIDGSQIIVKALPETEKHLEAVHGCADYIKNKEWPAVDEKLADYAFPHVLNFEIDESCLDTSVPDIAVKPTAEVPANDPNPASRYSRDNYVFNVPYREKGAGVVGRAETLQTLRKQLTTSGGTAIGQTASFHGIGGLGKTQLAVEYAYHYKDTYPHGVIWIASDQEIEPQLVQVAKKGNWIAPESEHKLILEIARRRLKTFSNCLIIFDNVESPADIQKYLPEPEARPHIILTSRVPQDGFASMIFPCYLLNSPFNSCCWKRAGNRLRSLNLKKTPVRK